MQKTELDEMFDELQGVVEEEAAESIENNEAPADEYQQEPASEQEQQAAAEPANAKTDEPDELATLRAQNALLLEQLNSAYKDTPKENKVEETTEETAPNYFDGTVSFEDVIQNEESFKKFLVDFAQKITANTEERLLRRLPSTVAKLTTEQLDVKETVNNFYASHKQLAAVKPFVAKVVSTVASEHADWDLAAVLKESAVRAYKALGLKEQVAASEDAQTTRKPAFASPASGKRGALADAAKSKLEKELEELMDIE